MTVTEKEREREREKEGSREVPTNLQHKLFF